MSYLRKEPFTQSTADKAQEFYQEHVSLLGTVGYWTISEINRLAGHLYDQSQHYHESFTEEVLGLLLAHIQLLSQKEQSIYLPRFNRLAQIVRSNLDARLRMNTSDIKASQDDVYAVLDTLEILETNQPHENNHTVLPFSSEIDDEIEQELVS